MKNIILREQNRKIRHEKWKKDNHEHISNYEKEYYQKNKARILDRKKKERLNNIEVFKQKEALHSEKLKKEKYYNKVTRERKEKKLAEIAGRPRPTNCELCGSDKRIMFDHDHSTGKFRGWLCHNCNSALGHSRDNPELLYKMIAYLYASRTDSPKLAQKLQATTSLNTQASTVQVKGETL